MLLFEGEPALFFLFIISTLSLLIGGCLWGSGEDNGDLTKRIVGIVIFIVGCSTTVAFFVLYIIRTIRKRRRRKREIERILQLQAEVNANHNFKSDRDNSKYEGYENKAADLNENLSHL